MVSLIVEFNKLNQYEQPLLTLCNRSSVANVSISDRTVQLSETIGCIYDVSDFEIVWNFNAQSELNFVVELVVNSGDADRDMESQRIYNAIRGGRSIYVENYGYFIIDVVNPEMNEGVFTKSVHALSCETELSGVGLPYIAENVGIGIEDILRSILALLPTWSIKGIDANVRSRMRFFESTDIEDCYTFLMQNAQEAYECIIDYDIINREISIYDKNNYIQETDIHLTPTDFIRSMSIQEDTSAFFTSLYVTGRDGLDILSVNPLGTNEIYNLDYYKGDMKAGTLAAWESWEQLFNDQMIPYMLNEENYQVNYSNIVGAESDLDILQTRYNIYATCYDSVLSESLSTAKVREYNREMTDITQGIIETVGVDSSTPKDEAMEILRASMAEMEDDIEQQRQVVAGIEGTVVEGITSVKAGYYNNGQFYANRSGEEGSYTYTDLIVGTDGLACIEKVKHGVSITFDVYRWIDDAWEKQDITVRLSEALQKAIRETVSFENNFTDAQRIEISTFMVEGTYEDEYAIITDIMSYSERMDQYKQMYDRAKETLDKTAKPTYEYSIESDNFVFVPEMKHFTDELRTGSLVWIELMENDFAQLFLTAITINYSDASLSFTFGSRYNKFDTKSLYEDTMGNIKKTASTVNFLKDITLPIKKNKLTDLEEQIRRIRTLAKDEALRSDTEEVVIDSGGYLGRALKDNPEDGYSPEQVRLVHNRLLFTDDDWQTIKTVIGKINVDGTDYYGLDAQVIIGELIMAGKLKISNESGDYTFDENGVQMSFFNGNDGERIDTSAIFNSVNYTDTSNKYIKFQNGDILLFTVDEQNNIVADAMKLSSSSIRFYGNPAEESEHVWEPNEAAYIAKDSINITKARIFENIQFRRNEADGTSSNYSWLLFPRTNGNLSLKWTGGAVSGNS